MRKRDKCHYPCNGWNHSQLAINFYKYENGRHNNFKQKMYSYMLYLLKFNSIDWSIFSLTHICWLMFLTFFYFLLNVLGILLKILLYMFQFPIIEVGILLYIFITQIFITMLIFINLVGMVTSFLLSTFFLQNMDMFFHFKYYFLKKFIMCLN